MSFPNPSMPQHVPFDDKMLMPFFMNPSVDPSHAPRLATPPFVHHHFTTGQSLGSSSVTMSRRTSTDLEGERIPRPLNCFMTYRKEKQYEVLSRKGPDCNNKEISRLVAAMWNAEPEEVKEIYRQKAELGRQEHARKYPGYKYRPRKRSERMRQQHEAEARRRAERRAKREGHGLPDSGYDAQIHQQRQPPCDQRHLSYAPPVYTTDTTAPFSTTTTLLSSGGPPPPPNMPVPWTAGNVQNASSSPVAYPSNALPAHWVNASSTANFNTMILPEHQPFQPVAPTVFNPTSGFSPYMTPTRDSPELLAAAAAATNNATTGRSPSFSPQSQIVRDDNTTTNNDSDKLSDVTRLDSVFMTPALGPTDLPFDKEAQLPLDLSNALEPWAITSESMNPFSIMLSE